MNIPRRTILAGALAVAILPSARRVSADDDDGTRGLLARIAKARAPVRTLRGPFTQRRTIGLLATDVRSTGIMMLVRPDRLRWQLDPPDEVTFWMGPEGLAYRSAHGQGAMPQAGERIAGALEDVRTLLAGDLQKLALRWTLRVTRDDSSGAELEATAPPGSPSTFRAIQLTLAHDLVRPTRAVLAETVRDRTIIEFGQLAVNEPIPDAAMKP